MLDELLRAIDGLGRPANLEAIRSVEAELSVTLPADYVEFLLRSNGVTGWNAPNAHFVLWPVEELASGNRDYEVRERQPSWLCIGSDGGGSGFFFDFAEPGPPVLTAHHISDWPEDSYWHGESFTDFLARVVRGWTPLGEGGVRNAR